MIIIQRQTPLFAPLLDYIPLEVEDVPGVVSTATHRSFGLSLVTDSEHHTEYDVVGVNLSAVESYSCLPAESVDFSSWPRVKPNLGYTGEARIFAGHSSAATVNRVAFGASGSGPPYKSGPLAPVASSYCEYSHDVVMALCDAVADNRVFENGGSQNRVNTATLPHEKVTGVVWRNYATSTIAGYRPIAITPRVLFNCGHYSGSLVGTTLHWKDVNNNIVSRQVTHEINLYRSNNWDAAFYLLDSDLPEEIEPIPIAGDWASGIVSETSDSITYCCQMYGIVLFGNDGHWGPVVSSMVDDTTVSNDLYLRPSAYPPNTFDGVLLNRRSANRPHRLSYQHHFWHYEGNPQLADSIAGGKFAHNTRGGDSGSPLLIPVAGGWALSGVVSSSANPTEATCNAIIAQLESRAGLSAGAAGTVTVAPDPTL